MEFISHLSNGFSTAAEPMNLFYCMLGVLIGTLVGVLPGIGPVTAMALLLPVSFSLSPIPAIIMIAGIYYGAMYGGSTTSILLSIPGEPSSVVTCFDGYQMARQGRAGPALGISAIGSLIGGSLTIMGMAFFAPVLASFAIKFGPVELFAVMILGISILAYVAMYSMRKAIISAALGCIFGIVGQDLISGTKRFIFGIPELQEGLNIIPVAMGLYGITEILCNVEKTLGGDVYAKKIKNLLPSLDDWRKCLLPIFRGTGIGFFCGLIPGAGPTLSTFISYGVEKKISKHPEYFGKGAIEGVAAPETANNAAAQAAFIPLLTLGIPTTASAAMLFGALMIHGVTPGPFLISNHSQLFWGLTVSMWIGNAMLLILNLPLIGLWVKVLKIPYNFLMPSILVFCIIGSYCLRNTYVDVLIMLAFGVIGYFMKKFNYETAPLIMTLIISPKLEETLRQSLIISQGNFNIFLKSAISVIALSISTFLFISPFFTKRRLSTGYD